jgi:hypothetical protein
MKKGTKIALGVVLVVVAIFVIVRMSGNSSASTGKYDGFAQCLTDSGVVMYGSFTCPHCTRQKESFGNSWKYVNSVECTLPNGGQTRKCIDAGIESYPTWDFGEDERASGFIPLRDLGSKAGCSLPD